MQIAIEDQDRPARTEVVITSAMKAAGAAVIEEKASFYPTEALASMVYTAMKEAQESA